MCKYQNVALMHVLRKSIWMISEMGFLGELKIASGWRTKRSERGLKGLVYQLYLPLLCRVLTMCLFERL